MAKALGQELVEPEHDLLVILCQASKRQIRIYQINVLCNRRKTKSGQSDRTKELNMPFALLILPFRIKSFFAFGTALYNLAKST
jgi:hypothetical protein